MTEIYMTITEIKSANRRIGKHFFSPGAMRFFNSKVHPGVYGNHYFITSEQNGNESLRRYSIRRCDEGEISTIGEYNEIKSLAEAKKIIKEILKKEGEEKEREAQSEKEVASERSIHVTNE